jgi:hypothetical protein
MQESYSKVEWSEPTPDVMRVLAQNGIRGCGEFYQKASPDHTGEFAVACTHLPDGRASWTGYLVWVGIDKVEGPDLTAVYQHFGGPPRQLTKDDL